MPQPFSMLGAPNHRPTAVGESGYHLPVMPLLSGQDAVDSLVGYYPTRRMDSKLNPHTYRWPAGLRATTMPNTKVAALLAASAGTKLATLDLTRSGLVRGFLEKCAAANLDAPATLAAITAAMQVHRHIAAEFEKCGVAGIPKPPAVPAPGKLLQPLPPKPPLQPKLNLPEGPSTGFGTGLAQGAANAARLLPGAAMGVGGAALGTAMLPATAAAYGSDAMGLTSKAGPVAWAANKGLYENAAAGARDVIKPFNPYEASLPGGHHAALAQRQANESLQMGEPGMANAIRFANQAKNVAVNGAAGGGLLGGTKLLGQGLVRAVPALAPVANAATNAASAATKAYAHPRVGQVALGTELAQQGVDQVAGVNEFGTPRIPISASGAMQRFVGEPMARQNIADGISAGPPIIPSGGGQTATDGDGQQTAEQAPVAATGAQPSIVTQVPQYDAVKTLVAEDPQQAKGFFDQAVGTVKGWLSAPEGKTEANSVMKNGTLTPEGQQKALTALTAEGYDLDQATELAGKMSGWEQFGMWAGLGLAGIGLINAMSGGSGLASIIMTLLGLGTAGFTAGKAGLIDQGAQDLTQGLSDVFHSGGAAPEVPAAVKASLPTLLSDAPELMGAGKYINGARDQAMTLAMQQLAKNPEIAKQLDRAAGTGSWGNAGLSLLGDLSGGREQMMQQSLGLNPQQQDKLLQLWTQMRGQ